MFWLPWIPWTLDPSVMAQSLFGRSRSSELSDEDKKARREAEQLFAKFLLDSQREAAQAYKDALGDGKEIHRIFKKMEDALDPMRRLSAASRKQLLSAHLDMVGAYTEMLQEAIDKLEERRKQDEEGDDDLGGARGGDAAHR